MEMKKMLRTGIVITLVALSAVSCVTNRKIAYLQDMKHATQIELENRFEAVISPYDELDVANQRVKTLSKEYLKQVDSILEPAKKKVKDAQQKKYEAIKAFNEKFGPFRTIYTGQKAIDEFSRINKLADDFWNRFWF